MNPKTKAAIVHICLIVVALGAVVATAAGGAPTGWIAGVAAVFAALVPVAHWLLGYFSPAQPPVMPSQK